MHSLGFCGFSPLNYHHLLILAPCIMNLQVIHSLLITTVTHQDGILSSQEESGEL